MPSGIYKRTPRKYCKRGHLRNVHADGGCKICKREMYNLRRAKKLGRPVLTQEQYHQARRDNPNRKLYCKRGHLRTPENLTTNRTCRLCQALRNHEQVSTEKYKNYARLRRASKEGKQYSKEYSLNSRGWTTEMYEASSAKQEGLCAICKQLPTGQGCAAILHADHDHTTKEPRALLCSKCNTAIGLLLDSPEICRAAAEYIELWRMPVAVQQISTQMENTL